MQIVFNVPDSLVPELQAMLEEAGVATVGDLVRSFVFQGVKKRMLEKAMVNRQAQAQQEVNTKILQIQVVQRQ